MERFPPRPVLASWAATAADRFTVVRRLLAPPFVRRRRTSRLAEAVPAEDPRLARAAPGDDLAAAVEGVRRRGGRGRGLARPDAGRPSGARQLGSWDRELHHRLGTGPGPADLRRHHPPGAALAAGHHLPGRVAAEMGRVRDPAGIAALKALREAARRDGHFDPAWSGSRLIMAAKAAPSRTSPPATASSCWTAPGRVRRHAPHPPGQPVQLRAPAPPGPSRPARRPRSGCSAPGSPGRLPRGRWSTATTWPAGPIRDLIVDYLRERQPGIDYSSLNRLATTLGLRFWKDLETHHPGIGSLHLPPDVAAAWKQRQTRTVRAPDGGEQPRRESAATS